MIFELVYTSVLAPTFDVRGVADMVRRSRSFNLENALTGMLVFDGARFCQHIEGAQAAVLSLVAKIEADTRHEQFRILYQGFVGPKRRFAEWSMAYALDTQGTLLEALAKSDGAQTARMLQDCIPQLVIQPSWP